MFVIMDILKHRNVLVCTDFGKCVLIKFILTQINILTQLLGSVFFLFLLPLPCSHLCVFLFCAGGGAQGCSGEANSVPLSCTWPMCLFLSDSPVDIFHLPGTLKIAYPVCKLIGSLKPVRSNRVLVTITVRQMTRF